MEFQAGRCWGCRRATGRSKALSLDHNHKNGIPRGWLCDKCNNILAHLRDDPVALFRLGLYLIDPPFDQMRRQ
jgi:hypothetical protein